MADGEGPESLVGLPEGIEGWGIVGGGKGYILFFFLCCFVVRRSFRFAFGVVYCYVCVLYFTLCVVLVFVLSDCIRLPSIVYKL